MSPQELQYMLNCAGINDKAAALATEMLDEINRSKKPVVPEYDHDKHVLLRCRKCPEIWSKKIPTNANELSEMVATSNVCPECRAEGVVLA